MNKIMLRNIFTVIPSQLRPHGSYVGELANLVNGTWVSSNHTTPVINPMTGHTMLQYPSVPPVAKYMESMREVPKYGLHNPLLHQDRYLHYGEISQKTAQSLDIPEINDYFVKLIQAVMPKSEQQAKAEVDVTKKFLYNFSGDQVRFLAQGKTTPGDHYNQQSTSYRFPYGPTALITPFNFPLEIPVLQMMGALYMGNKVLVKNCEKTSVVIEQFIRLLHHNGMPLTDVDLIHGESKYMEELVRANLFSSIQFTGSSGVAEKLSRMTHGKVKIEDAGVDFKILGPDICDVEEVATVSDNDAYHCSGQKCSAQSLLFVHENWTSTTLFEQLRVKAAERSLDDLTIGPTLTWTTDAIRSHIDDVLSIEGSTLLFGGNELKDHTIPPVYGAMEPTAVQLDISAITPENIDIVSKELFGPFQLIITYRDVDDVIQIVNRLPHHLTAAIVSNNPVFYNHVLSRTMNGTTYFGNKARTTGAPQNHFFGPGGDPRAGGIGTKEAIQNVWSYHRELIQDFGS